MNNDGLILLLKIVSFAAIVALLYFFFRKKKPAEPKTDPVLDAKIQELRNQGMPEEAAVKQATADYQAAMKARQKKTYIIMGGFWMVAGVVFVFINGLEVSSIALIGLGVVQIIFGLMIKTGQG